MKDKLLMVGYAGSGKSTIADKYVKNGYTIIHTDEIITNVIMKKFSKDDLWYFNIYAINIDPKLETVVKYFVGLMKKYIKKHKKIIIEGQIRNADIIRNIFGDDDFDVLLVKPKNKSTYKKRVTSRFEEDPANYGRLGRLANIDAKNNKQGLNDYIKNGINGKIIKKLITDMVNETYGKHEETYNHYIKYFPNIKIIIN